MKKIKTLVSVFCLFIVILSLCGCGAESKITKAIKNISSNLSKAQTITSVVTVKDGDFTAYSLTRTVTFDGDNASIQIKESKLSSDFTMNETTSTERSDKATQAVLPLKLAVEDMEIYLLKDDVLTCVIGQENASKAFASQSYSVAGDINVRCNLTKGRLEELTCSFSTETGKVVTLVVTCAY